MTRTSVTLCKKMSTFENKDNNNNNHNHNNGDDDDNNDTYV